MTLHLSGTAPADSTWFKYDPVDDTWYDYSAYIEFSADRKIVYLTLVDGGFGDADGIENGIIVDPLGLGVLPSYPAAAAEAVDAGSSSWGGGSGCFISTTAFDFRTSSLDVARFKFREIAFVLSGLLLFFLLDHRVKKGSAPS